VNRTGAGWVGLDFAFQELKLNLRDAQVATLSTLVSPGLRIAGANWTVGGIRAQTVDQAFQAEINQTIDAQIQQALSSANESVLDGALSREILQEAFQKIFRR